MSKANARDWREQQQKEAEQKEDLEDQVEKLFYAANKRDLGYPNECTLRALGHHDVANLVSQAYSLLGEAECLLRNKLESK